MKIVSIFLFFFVSFPLSAFSAPQPFECAEAACGAGTFCRVRPNPICEACDPNAVCEIEGCQQTTQEAYCVLSTPFCEDGCDNDFSCIEITLDRCEENNQAVSMCDENGENCITPKPAPCTPVSNDYCAPGFVGKCESDVDCGSGFTCNKSERCELVIRSCASQNGCKAVETCVSDEDWPRENTPCDDAENCTSKIEGKYCVPKLYSSWAEGGGSASFGGDAITSVGKAVPNSGCSVSGTASPFWFGLAFSFFFVRRRKSKN